MYVYIPAQEQQPAPIIFFRDKRAPCNVGWYLSGSCVPCPAGKYCPDQTEAVPCPPHLPFSQIGSSICLECPAGYACTPGSEATLCSEGYYSKAGDGACTQCPKGYKCPDRTADPVRCSAGYYASSLGSTSCLPCVPGQACPVPDLNPVTCASGTYSGFAATSCIYCPAGKYCPRTDLDPIDCLAGEYSLGGATSCTACEAGKACSSKTAVGTDCAPGTFSIGGQTACTTCPAGYICPSTTVAPTTLCGAGTYSLAGSTRCTPCPMGKPCPYTTAAPTGSCSSNYYQLGEVGYCKQCEPGYECPSQNERRPCALGTYSIGLNTCTNCPAGKYCPTTTREPLDCPAGTYCPVNSVTYIDCPIGHECTSTSTAPAACSAGKYSLGRQTSCTTCPEGFYCPSVSSSPILCPLGYYTSAAGQTSCTECPAGSYCIGALLSLKKIIGAGYYSYAGMYTYIQCMPGYQCPNTDGTGIVRCNQGYYSDFANSAACTQCEAGYACPTTAAHDKYACPAGTYSSLGSTYCTVCPAGHSCATDGTPQACDVGQFAMYGAAVCTDCPAGHFCPYSDAPHVLPCPPGTYSEGKQIICTVCPAGFNCSTRTQKLDCKDALSNYATYAPQGSHVCSPCPGGIACGDNGVVTPCPAGKYSSAQDIDCLDCPEGSYCPTGTSKPILCPPGTSSGANQVICTHCVLGSYAIENSTSCTPCPAGSYCPAPHITPRLCPPGTFSGIGQAACTPCTPGKLCGSGNTSASIDCPVGHYCNYITITGLGGNGVLPCPAGTYRDTVGATKMSDCIPCTIGKFCLEGASEVTNCPKGHYCPAKTQYGTQFPCPAGTYNSIEGKEQVSDCLTCTAGNYCPSGAVSPLSCPPGYYCPIGTGYLTNNQLMPAGYYTSFSSFSSATGSPCLAGYYCPIGCVVPTPCPPGTYRATVGASAKEQCLKCIAGKPCPRYANTAADSGIHCPKGYYCPAGTEYPTQFPCPAGTYNDAQDMTQVSNCLVCTAGFGCDEATNSDSNPMKKCQPGYYCPAGSKSPKEIPCPAGKFSTAYNLATEAACTDPCEAGYYCLQGSDRLTGECQEGYYCPEGSAKPNAVPCPAGTYSNYRRLSAAANCTVCPVGYYCPEASTTPLECPAGTYNDVATGIGAVANCKTCTAGYYCPRGSPNRIECGLGKYSPAGAARCFDCLPTYFCGTATTSDTTMLSSTCPAGYYCPQGTGLSSTYPCPAGSFCPANSDRAIKCSPGQVSIAAQSACTSISAGSYTEMGSGVATGKCTAGYYCEAGSWSPTATICPGGKYRATAGGASLADCLECPEKYYCPEATANPIICPQGYYCPAGSSVPTKCYNGTYGPKFGLYKVEECLPCPSGTYCSLNGLAAPEGLCDSGYYCILGANISTPTDGVTGDICPAGGYCETGSRASQSCPPGRYNPKKGGRDLEDCVQCTPGKYCSGEAKSTETGDCDAGYYCPTGSYMKNMKPASPGYYSTVGLSEALACAEGYYNPYYAQSSCIQCPAGFLCKGTANSGTFINCPKGAYCPIGSILKTVCPKGTYNPNYNGKSLSDCWDCPPGKYCSIEGLSSPGDGTSSSDSDCDAGYYCKTKSDTKAPDSQQADGNYGPCPVGHYCPKGISNPIPCAPGTYSDETKISSQAQCKSCTAGYYCSSSGLSAPEGLCGGGYFCPSGSKVIKLAANVCPVGHYCPVGSPSAKSCAAGTYQYETGQTSCITCPQGYYCPSQTSSLVGLDCPRGYYCPAGTSQANENPCPIGKYNPRKNAYSLSHCLDADPGYYVSGVGNYEVAGPCSAGYYCKLGSPTATPPSNATGAPADHGNECPLGSYCPAGSAMPIKCPGGKYCSKTKLAANEGSCSAGYFCRLGATSKTPTTLAAEGGNKCTAGHYCVEGSDSPRPCPPGTYSAQTGNTALSNCAPCPNGKYCQDAGATSETGSCSAGYYCKVDAAATIGYTVPNPIDKLCPIGHKCAEGTVDKVACTSSYQDLQGQSSCNACPAGYYCTTSAKFLCQPRLENLSFYCPEDIMEKVTCPTGTYNVIDGSSSISDCVKCPVGYYCPVDSAKDKIIPCPAGVYCNQEGNSKPTGDGKCPSGYYCPVGTYSAIPCPAGRFCESEGLTDSILTDSNYECTAGYICYSTSITATPTDGTKGNICPAGYYCPKGTKAPIACAIGTYRSLTGGSASTDCSQCTAGSSCPKRGLSAPVSTCPAGYYCPTGSSLDQLNACPIGAMCPSGSSAYEVCPNKKYQNKPQQASCIDCPARYYCLNGGVLATAAKPQECPIGKYCPVKSENPTNCPPSTFNPRKGLASEEECESCTPGHYCATAGLSTPTEECDAGYYCTGGSKSKTPNDATGSMCTKGHYCPKGSIYPTPCPPGTYNDLTQRTQLSDCTACPAGYFCPLRGATSMELKFGSSTFQCLAGFLCKTKATIPNPTDTTTGIMCRAGYYCPTGTTSELPCSKGFYNPNLGQSECKECPAGKLCNAAAMETPLDCPVGHYCPAGSYSAIACPAGTYSPFKNLQSSSECIICDPGKYCLGGQTTPDGTCTEGYVCVKGSPVSFSYSIYSLAANTNGQCPQGYKCPAGCTAPIPCPMGTYKDSTGGNACQPCPAGKYCDELGMTSTSKDCAAGHVCTGGAKFARPVDSATEGGRLCNPGHYCPEGSSIDKVCPIGKYEPRSGSSACQTCPMGYYCPNTGMTTPIACLTKYYCPEGSSAPTFCPDGTFGRYDSLERDDQCLKCLSGKYCKNGVVQDDCNAGYYCNMGASKAADTNKLCPAGHYCTKGTKLPTRCPDGKFNINVGATDITFCKDCTSGYYCIAGSSVPISCPKGHYCVPPSSKPDACPKGTYQPDTLQIDFGTCKWCPAGTYCYEEAIYDYSMYPCPVGKYCLAAANSTSFSPYNCPLGTYRNTTGATKAEDCTNCTGGYYCEEGTIHPKPCRGGYYCNSTLGEIICPAGKYCPPISTSPINCPAAYYCPEGSELYKKCENGYFCPENSTNQTQCPEGYVGSYNANNVNASMGCTQCTPGFYSYMDGSTLTCVACTPGYVCLGGTTVANPTNVTLHKGHICPIGYYCPAGTYSPESCGKGTYNNKVGATSSSDCLKCPTGTFNPNFAQSSCRTCGGSSISSDDGKSCVCTGKYRAYQVETEKCLCIPFYEPASGNSNEDSSEDCQPLIYSRCSNDQIRDPSGSCKDKDDCSQCPKGKGKRSSGIGICECVQVEVLDDICNDTCRSVSLAMRVSYNGTIIVTDPTTGKEKEIDTSSLPTMYGNMSAPSSSNKIVSVSVKSGVGFSSNYQPAAGVLASYNSGSRLLTGRKLASASDSGITSPIICLSLGDTMIFSISSGNYPVYDKDNLLNTNPTFDFSSFNNLDIAMQGGATYTEFSFTFVQAGRYVFVNKANTAFITIIGVMDSNEKCSDSSRYIQPITSSSLLKLGISQNEDIILTPDWGLIFGLIAAILFGTPLLIGFIRYFSSSSWIKPKAENIKYRQVNKESDYDEFTSKGKEWKRELYNKPENDNSGDDKLGIIVDEDSPLISKPNEKEKQIIEMRKKENIEGVHEISTDIFRDLYKELQYHAKFVKDEFARKAGMDSENIKKVFAEIDRLKLLMQEKLQNTAKSYGKGMKLIFTENNEGEGIFMDNEEEGEGVEEKKEESVISESEEDKPDDKIEFNPQILEEIDQRDQQKIESIAEKIREDQENIKNEWKDQEKERKEKFVNEINANKNLTEEEKKALINEYDRSNERLMKLMMLQEKSGDERLQQQLDQRRKNRMMKQKEIEQLQENKQKIQSEFEDKRNQIEEQKQVIQASIDQEIEREKAEEIEKLEKKKNNELQGVRKKFQKKLKDDISEAQRASMLDKFGSKMKALEEELELSRKKEQEEILMKLDMKRQSRRAEREIELRKREKELKEQQGKELKQINLQIQSLNDNLMNEQMEEMILRVKEEEKKGEAEEDALELEKQVEINKEKETEKAIENEENSKAQRELILQQEQDEIEALNKEREEADKAIQTKASEVKSKKTELQIALGKATNPAEKRKLLEDYQHYEADVAEQVKNDLNKQGSNFEDKMAERRRKREARELEMRENQERELDELRRGNRREEDMLKRKMNEQKLQKQIEKLKMMLTQDEIPFAVERLIDEMQLEEMADVLRRQLQDKSRVLRRNMEKLLELKTKALEQLKHDNDEQTKRAKELVGKGLMKKEEYKAKLEELKAKRDNSMKEVEYEFAQKQAEVEEKNLLEQEKKNSEELIDMTKYHANQKQMYMQAFVSNDFLKKILAGDKSKIDKEIEEYENELNAEYERKNRELEEKKKRIEELLQINESKIKDLELQAQKMMRDQELREKKREEKKKKELQEQMASKEAEIAKNQNITDEKKRELLEQHQAQMNQLIESMEKERIRQSEMIKASGFSFSYTNFIPARLLFNCIRLPFSSSVSIPFSFWISAIFSFNIFSCSFFILAISSSLCFLMISFCFSFSWTLALIISD